MSKLLFSLDGAFLGEYPLEKERMTIGRRPTNDIHIDNLAVSGQHAAVISIGNDAFLEDLDSTNGTLVNGKPVKKHVLQHGDVIEIGKYQLKFVNEAVINAATGGAPPQDFDKTMIIRPSAVKPPAAASTQAGMNTTTIQPAAAEVKPAPAAPAPAAPPPAPAPASAPASAPAPAPAATPAPAAAKPAAAAEAGATMAHIQVLNGPSMGKELVLSKALTTLGKPGVQVAVITRRPQGYFITHVEGQQHPVVNGESVGAQAHQLNDHDVIELAGVKMEFYFVSA